MKILLAEDDKKLSRFLCQLFSNRDIEVDLLNSGEDIEYYALNNEYDVLVLDWMLPNVTGLEACQLLREKGYGGGILMLTARTTLQDKIDGFNCGADDYLVKPFEFDELCARVYALKRRANVKFNADIFKVGNCTFNCTEKVVQYHDVKVYLTNREFQIAELLARNAGQIVSRDIIYDRVWGIQSDISSNNLDANIKLIRKKLELVDGKQFIHNLRAVGYRWEETDV